MRISVIGPDVLWVLANELADAELAAVPASASFEPTCSVGEVGQPLAQLFAGRVAVCKTFDDRVGGELAALKGEPNAGRIDRVDEPPESPTSTHPSPEERASCRNTLSRHPARPLSRCLRVVGAIAGQSRHLGREDVVRRAGTRAEKIIRIAHARRCSPRRSTAECARTTIGSTACESKRS